MDVTSIASSVNSTQPGSLDQQMGVMLLKQAMHNETMITQQLMSTITPASNLPDNIGQNINVSV